MSLRPPPSAPIGGIEAPPAPPRAPTPPAPEVIQPTSPEAPVSIEPKEYKKPETVLLGRLKDTPVTLENARQALTQIAEHLPERLAMASILDRAATEFFHIRDGERFILTVMARRVVDSPMGQEFRNDVLRMIKDLNLAELSTPKSVSQDQLVRSQDALRNIKNEIDSQSLVKSKEAGTSPFLKWTQEKGIMLPDNVKVPITLGEGIESKVSDVIKNLPNAREDLWQQIMGEAVPMKNFFNPEQLLSISQINPSEKNKKILGEMLRPKENKNYKGMVLPSLGLAFMLLMMASQFAQEADKQPSAQ